VKIMNDLKVFEYDGQLVMDSRLVARMVGKEHKNLIADIRGYIEIMESEGQSNFGPSENPEIGKLKIQPSDFFIESSYISSQNKKLPCYLITKKGCDMVANKMTGEKGVLFTATYVTEFEKMKEKLANGSPKKAIAEDEKAKQQRSEAMLNNSKARVAKIYLKIAENVDIPEYKQIMYSKAAEVLSGEMALPLPKAERKTYSATEIGEKLGISAQRVGSLTNEYELKTEQYGQWVWDKSRSSNKQVQSFRYYENIIPALEKILKG